LQTISGHTAAVRHAAFANDDKWLISASDDKSVRIFDRASGSEIKKLDFASIPSSFELSRNGSILSVCSGLKVSFWDVEKLEKMFGSRGQKRPRNVVNINPFNPSGMLMKQANKRRKSSPLGGSFITVDTPIEANMMSVFTETDDGSDEEKQEIDVSVDIPDNDNPNSRFRNDFHAVAEIGSGEFGKVYKCINKLDGCIYAVKKTKKPMRGSRTEKKALNEVYAHAVLGKHHRIVRYYSAWAEKEHMYIQNEYCDGGSLAEIFDELRVRNEKLTEHQLKKIIKHVAQGLKFIHSQKLSHMDIKPENIFISNSAADALNNSSLNRTLDSSDDGFDEDDYSDVENINELTYKIGDLGLVTNQGNTCVEEGDCRYLPLEVLQDNYDHLDKADIFALGLTIYEAATLEPLPKNGTSWRGIRNGDFKPIANYSNHLNSLIRRLIDIDPTKRPSAHEILQEPYLAPLAEKSKAQLRRELINEKFRNSFLSKQLELVSKSALRNSFGGTTTNNSRFMRSKSVTF